VGGLPDPVGEKEKEKKKNRKTRAVSTTVNFTMLGELQRLILAPPCLNRIARASSAAAR
jgi:hypothetical protein